MIQASPSLNGLLITSDSKMQSDLSSMFSGWNVDHGIYEDIGYVDQLLSDQEDIRFLIIDPFDPELRENRKPASLKRVFSWLEKIHAERPSLLVITLFSGKLWDRVTPNQRDTLAKFKYLNSDEDFFTHFTTFFNELEGKDDLPSSPLFLVEVKGLKVFVFNDKKPWLLDGDVMVLPVSKDHIGVGGIISAMQSEGFEPWIKDAMRALSENPISWDAPALAHSEIDKTKSGKRKALIYATCLGGDDLFQNAIGAMVACCQLADLNKFKKMVLPIIGSGAMGQDSLKIAGHFLQKLDSYQHLEEVILVTLEKGFYEAMVKRVGVSELEETKTAINQKFLNDQPRGEDLLDIKKEAHALADAILLKEMEPPLVVGVLGGWGSGKSFVLHLMQQRMAQIRQMPLNRGGKGSGEGQPFPFCGHPYLVRFDAWTYAKSNLWASLMREIFFQLNEQMSLERCITKAAVEAKVDNPLMKGVDLWAILDGLSGEKKDVLESALGPEIMNKVLKGDKDLTPDTLWEKLKEHREEELKQLEKAEKNLEDEKQAWQKNLAAVNGALEQAVEAKCEQEAWVPFRRELAGPIAEAIDTVLEKAGKDPLNPPTFKSVMNSVGFFKRIRENITGQGLSFIFFALAAVVVMVMKHFEMGVTSAENLGMGDLGAGGITGLAAAAITFLKKASAWLNEKKEIYDKHVQTFREKGDELKAALLNDPDQRTQELSDELTALAKKAGVKSTATMEAMQAGFEARIEEMSDKVEQHRRRVGLTARWNSMFDFVKNRVESGYYDQHLGLVHQVQKDLEELSDALVTDYRDGSKSFPRGKPRIILVIDDLDRCPPHQVVDILEAAQLLVKTPLFVVVLAMDVRFVTLALEKAYEGILRRNGDPSGLDYIEKIIQIPYRVPSIKKDSLRRFLESQMDLEHEEKEERQETRERPEPEEPDLLGGEAPAPPPAPVEQGYAEPATRSAPQAPEPVLSYSIEADGGEEAQSVDDAGDESEVIFGPITAETLTFDETEVSLLEEACQVAEVRPRAGKRLVNVFKLMKIIWHHRDHEPEDDIKRVMLLLLSLSAQHPNIMRLLLHQLEEIYTGKIPEGSLQEFILTRFNDTPEEERSEEWRRVRAVLKKSSLLPERITVQRVGAENMRLVTCFSFVGEVDRMGALAAREQPV